MEVTEGRNQDVQVPCAGCVAKASNEGNEAVVVLCVDCLAELKRRAEAKKPKQQDQAKQDVPSRSAEQSIDKEAIAATLKRLSDACNEMINKRDFDLHLADSQEFVNGLAPDFKSRFDNMTEPVTFAEQIAFWRDFAEQHPKSYFKATDMAVLFDQRMKKATVEMKCEIYGVSNISMSAVCRFKWRREEDFTWACFDLTAMRYAIPSF